MVNDDLLQEAKERLQQQEDEDQVGDDLGDQIELGVGEHFHGRWRGDDGTMQTRDGAVSVYLLWDQDGGRHFHYKNARLVQEIDDLRPTVGDEVLILRGPDVEFTAKGGETRTMYRFAVRARPCPDPLPAGRPTSAVASGSPDDDFPF